MTDLGTADVSRPLAEEVLERVVRLFDYARTDPDAVRRYVAENRGRLSPLSVREASKHL
jgi:hypothetical protein